MPECSLKYLPKKDALGKFSSSAICCIVISVKRSLCSIALRVKKQIRVLGFRFVVFISNFDRYFGVTFSICANSSTLRIRPSLCSTNLIKRSANCFPWSHGFKFVISINVLFFSNPGAKVDIKNEKSMFYVSLNMFGWCLS